MLLVISQQQQPFAAPLLKERPHVRDRAEHCSCYFQLDNYRRAWEDQKPKRVQRQLLAKSLKSASSEAKQGAGIDTANWGADRLYQWPAEASIVLTIDCTAKHYAVLDQDCSHKRLALDCTVAATL